MRNKWIVFFWVALAMASDSFALEKSYLKAGLRTGAGSFEQIYRGKSYETSYFFPDFTLLYFGHPRIAVGGGLDFHRVIKYSILDYWAWRFSTRFYPVGYGVPKVVVMENFEAFNWSRWGFYVGADFKRYHYSLPVDPRNLDSVETNGNFSQFCAGVGAEYRILPNFDINFEVSTSVYSFAETDILIRPYTVFALLGLGFAW